MRSWSDSKRFDLVFSSCGSMTHLLTLQDQLAAWRQSHENLNRGGRFVVDVPMPAMAAYADSFQVPPRAVLEVDRDVMAEESADRLIRYKSTRYLPHKQRAHIRFFYHKFEAGTLSDYYISDFESHVYFPRELELLCTQDL